MLNHESTKQSTLTVTVAGDICMRDISHKVNAEYAKDVLSKIKSVLNNADVRLINLENPVIDGGTPIPKSGPNLKALPQDLSILVEGNFDCAVLANNHIGDYNEEGVYSTIKELDKLSIQHVGAGKNIHESYLPWYNKVNGCTLAVIAVAENEFGVAEDNKAGVAGFNMYKLSLEMKQAKLNSDFLMVIFHGGNEYNPLPSPRVVERYRLIADNGADAVIGMHPHCPQGYEIYNGTPIVYSTGNFLFNNTSQSNPKSSWYYGYLPTITFSKDFPAKLDITPYSFDKDCTLISPFDGNEKNLMLEYLKTISEEFQNNTKLKEYFKGWCLISGVSYAKAMVFKQDYLTDSQYSTKPPMLALRNLLTCEAHNELMTVLLKMIADGDLESGYAMVDRIKELQNMPV